MLRADSRERIFEGAMVSEYGPADNLPPVPDLDVDHSSFDYKARWNSLRSIGNSPVARASLAIPILGYIILFHQDLINYLQLHANFCKGCTVSWRLHFFYFGCCAFAIGALLYGFFCPTLIKRYAGATDFFQEEKYYFTNRNNFEYLQSLIKKDRRNHKYSAQTLSTLKNRGDGDPTDLYYLGGVMGEHYVLQNYTYPIARLAVLACYTLGSVLLFIPTAATFLQVLLQVVF